MAEISKITLPSGTTYDLKDATAREDIETLQELVAGGVQYVGVTTTALSDGATTTTVAIKSGDTTTDHTAAVGDMVTIITFCMCSTKTVSGISWVLLAH